MIVKRDDNTVWDFLTKQGFTEDRFLIHIPPKRKLTEEESEAIQYLIEEWDWDAERNGISIWYGNEVKP